MKTEKEQEAFRNRVLALRQTTLGITLYKVMELQWNSAQLEHQPGVREDELKYAYATHSEALSDLLNMMFEIEGIE